MGNNLAFSLKYEGHTIIWNWCNLSPTSEIEIGYNKDLQLSHLINLFQH